MGATAQPFTQQATALLSDDDHQLPLHVTLQKPATGEQSTLRPRCALPLGVSPQRIDGQRHAVSLKGRSSVVEAARELGKLTGNRNDNGVGAETTARRRECAPMRRCPTENEIVNAPLAEL